MLEAEAQQLARDRRALERVPTTLRGKVFPGEIDCVVKDFNERGAKLQFSEQPVAGERVILVIWTSGLAFEAQVRWRTSAAIGVQFIQRCDFRSRTPAMFWPARAVWLKSRRPFRRSALKNNPVMIVTPKRRRGEAG